MKKTIHTLAALAALLLSQSVYSQSPEIEWHKTLGGSQPELPGKVLQTTDGNYIVLGTTLSYAASPEYNHSSSSTRDVWLVKLNSSGTIIWTRVLGSIWDENGSYMSQTSDGGYIIAANSTNYNPNIQYTPDNWDVTNYHGSLDAWIIKTDSNGIIEWARCFGGSGYDASYSIIETDDGNYAFVGTTNSSDGDITREPNYFHDLWLALISSDGNIITQKYFGGSNSEEGHEILQTLDGGFAIAGISSSTDGNLDSNNGDKDYWILKLNYLGELEWSKSYGGSNFDYGASIKQTNDDGYIISGTTFSNDFDVTDFHNDNTMVSSDAWILRLDSYGDIIWKKCYGGSGSDAAGEIILCSDGGYIFSGGTNSVDGNVTGFIENNGMWVVKINTNGEIEWQRCIGEEGHYTGGGLIQNTFDGGYIVTGTTVLEQTPGGDVNYSDLWIVKLSSIVNIDEANSFTFSLYPNPATDNITINNIERGSSISINDLTGKLIHQSVIYDVQTSINTAHLSSGVYTVQVKNDNRVATQKLVIDK